MQWDQIENTENATPITIRGFLFPGEENSWILSQDPNLKSCCVGHSDKKNSQIQLDIKEFNCKPNTLITATGTLLKGETLQLINTSLEKKEISAAPLIITTLIMLFVFRIIRKKRRV